MGVRSVGVEGGVTAGDRCSQCPHPYPTLLDPLLQERSFPLRGKRETRMGSHSILLYFTFISFHFLLFLHENALESLFKLQALRPNARDCPGTWGVGPRNTS